MIRKVVKYLLPHGLITVLRDRRELRKLGRTLKPSEWLHSDDLMKDAFEAGMLLIPAGDGERMKYVVDVGANEGQWSSMMLKLLNPTRAIAFEPVPATFEKLKLTLAGRPNVELRNIVVGPEQGTVKFKLTRDSKGASVLQPDKAMDIHVADQWQIVQEEDRPMDTLDHQLADLPEVSLLKIDVQGYEKQVLAGARETLKKTRFILIELNFFRQYQDGSRFDDVHKLMTEELGFFLCNMAEPVRFGNEAVYVDGLYANAALVSRR